MSGVSINHYVLSELVNQSISNVSNNIPFADNDFFALSAV